MQVLLVQDYAQLGQKGQVVNVKTGYFRNYLEPQGLARLATAQDKERFAKMEEERKQKRHAMVQQAAEVAGKLEGEKVLLTGKAAVGGSLYAQIHELEVAKELNTKFDAAIEASDIKFEKHVKKVGEYKFTVRLSNDHNVEMTLVVAEDGE